MLQSSDIYAHTEYKKMCYKSQNHSSVTIYLNSFMNGFYLRNGPAMPNIKTCCKLFNHLKIFIKCVHA